MASPVRFSPVSTSKPSRLSSTAISLASLMGSFSGASASGYFALPMTRANLSRAAHDWATGALETIKISSNARRNFIRRRSTEGRRSQARAAATLLYENCIIKPATPPLSTLVKMFDCRDNLTAKRRVPGSCKQLGALRQIAPIGLLRRFLALGHVDDL